MLLVGLGPDPVAMVSISSLQKKQAQNFSKRDLGGWKIFQVCPKLITYKRKDQNFNNGKIEILH